MARKRLQLSISLLLCMGTSLFAQSHWSANSFVIDANRPYVYLKFDHYGRGVHFGNDEPDLRFWFRFVNNCRVPVLLRTFGVPDGSLPHEVGVMDLVKRDEVEGFVTERPQPPLLTPIRPGLTQFSTKPAEKRKP